MITRKRLAILALVYALSQQAFGQVLPPPPPTVVEAVHDSNSLAFGYEKNTVAYWEGLPYASDPLYFWKRMLGWQSENGPDRAVFGLYAVPPSAWREVTAPPVEAPVPVTPLYLELVKRIDQLLGMVETLNTRVSELAARPCKVSLFGIPGSCKWE